MRCGCTRPVLCTGRSLYACWTFLIARKPWWDSNASKRKLRFSETFQEVSHGRRQMYQRDVLNGDWEQFWCKITRSSYDIGATHIGMENMRWVNWLGCTNLIWHVMFDTWGHACLRTVTKVCMTPRKCTGLTPDTVRSMTLPTDVVHHIGGLSQGTSVNSNQTLG